jgi:hypothetical protein
MSDGSRIRNQHGKLRNGLVAFSSGPLRFELDGVGLRADPSTPLFFAGPRGVTQDDRELRICLPFTTGKCSIRNAVKAPPIIRAGIQMPEEMASSVGW